MGTRRRTPPAPTRATPVCFAGAGGTPSRRSLAWSIASATTRILPPTASAFVLLEAQERAGKPAVKQGGSGRGGAASQRGTLGEGPPLGAMGTLRRAGIRQASG